MGVDLVGHSLRYNWAGWEFLFDTAVHFGWKPAGTEAPNLEFLDPDTEEVIEERSVPKDQWDGGYFGNDYQQVTDEDAAAWAAALYRALEAFDALDGQAVMTPDEAALVREFADAASRHGFGIG
jgi:hypothetical protein